MEAQFLPNWPLRLSEVALFGIILLAGLIGSQVVRRTGFLPRISGYLAIGLVVGPSGLNWLTEDLIGSVQFFVDIATGLILFELGRRLDLAWLRHDRGLLATVVAEALLSFAAVFFTLRYFGFSPLIAGLAGTIGISTSPAVVLLVAHELGAEGQVTRRAFSLTATNNVIAIVVFTVLLSLVHLNLQANLKTILLHPFYLLAGSVVAGYAVFYAMLLMARLVGKRESEQFIVLVGGILLAVGVAGMLNLPVLLTLLALGIFAKNLDRAHDLLEIEFGYASQLFFVLLFVVAGASMRFGHFTQAFWPALAFVIVRAAAKLLPAVAFARTSRLSVTQGAMLGVALIPLTGLAMAQSVAALYPGFGGELIALMGLSVTILEIVGPIATQYALKRAGESHPNV
jgi:Kef-type K+ transport system membrane component KefB